MDGLRLLTQKRKRYFVRPEFLELCEVSEAELREAEKHKPLPTDPVVVLPTHGKELSNWGSWPALSVVPAKIP